MHFAVNFKVSGVGVGPSLLMSISGVLPTGSGPQIHLPRHLASPAMVCGAEGRRLPLCRAEQQGAPGAFVRRQSCSRLTGCGSMLIVAKMQRI